MCCMTLEGSLAASVIGSQSFTYLSGLGGKKNINRTDLMHWTSGKTPHTDLASSSVFRVELEARSFVLVLFNARVACLPICVGI